MNTVLLSFTCTSHQPLNCNSRHEIIYSILHRDGTLKTIGPLESPARADLEVEAGEVTVGPPLESPARAVDLTAAGDVMIAAAGHLASLERAVDLTAPHGAALAGPLLESLARVVDGK